MTDRPSAGLHGSPEDCSALLEQLNAIGYRVVHLPSDEAVSIALVDMARADADRIISALATDSACVIVYGNDPDDLEEARFRALGATAVVVKRTLFDDLATHIPSIV